jgi:hypothetical protein
MMITSERDAILRIMVPELVLELLFFLLSVSLALRVWDTMISNV